MMFFPFHPLVFSPLAAVKHFIFRVSMELVFILHISVSNGQQPRGKSTIAAWDTPQQQKMWLIMPTLKPLVQWPSAMPHTYIDT